MSIFKSGDRVVFTTSAGSSNRVTKGERAIVVGVHPFHNDYSVVAFETRDREPMMVPNSVLSIGDTKTEHWDALRYAIAKLGDDVAGMPKKGLFSQYDAAAMLVRHYLHARKSVVQT